MEASDPDPITRARQRKDTVLLQTPEPGEVEESGKSNVVIADGDSDVADP